MKGFELSPVSVADSLNAVTRRKDQRVAYLRAAIGNTTDQSREQKVEKKSSAKREETRGERELSSARVENYDRE
jgi:2-phospho-L-lactate transferase/gluconeogenesis factor (CofD/UPF0052 family)